MAWFASIAKAIRSIARPVSLAEVAAVVAILVAMMLLIVTEIGVRSLLRRALPGVIEIAEFMMIAIAFLGMAYTALKKEHLTVDLVTSHFSARTQAVLNGCTGFFSIVVIFLMTWQSAVNVGAMRESGDTTAVLALPYFPMFVVVAFGTCVFLLVLLADLFDAFGSAQGRDTSTWLAPAGMGAFLLICVVLFLWCWDMPRASNRASIGVAALIVLFLLIFARMPIGLAMAFTGFLGFSYLRDVPSGLALIGMVPLRITESYLLCAVPLFLLMGQFASLSGMSRQLYAALRTWLGPMRGGLAVSTVAGCAAFAAITSSSVVTALTMSTLASPEMKRYGYAPALATGSLAVGGTLGILIPPSMGFILYALLTEQSIGKLFLAGFIPGLILASLFILTIYVLCRLRPDMGPPAPSVSWREKVDTLKRTWQPITLFGIVMGGLYGGLFTATEAAAVGAFTALVFALVGRRLSLKAFVDSFKGAGQMTSMIFVLMIGAYLFNYFLALTRLPFELVSLVASFELNRYVILALILLVYVFLGCIMDVFASMILTLPLVYPLITQLGFDPIWFGVIMVILLEMGLITPPIGMNVFFIAGVNKDVPMSTIFRGSAFFLPAFCICLFVLIALPQLTLVLPNLIIGK